MNHELFDIVIIGGGVNGCGIARDAAGRGRSVLLAEKSDLASGTSSASTKLIHGGLRYLEQFEFRLVRESLMEREVLLAMAPHIIRPMRFVLPHHRDLRPAWMIRIGMFLYDRLGKRSILPPSQLIDLRSGELGRPLKPSYSRGFEYSDCWVDDARLVVLNAVDAAQRGAQVRVRTQVREARRDGDGWTVSLRDDRSGEETQVRARVLINAAGPWISEVISRRIGLKPRLRTRLVKGSHIVVPSLFQHGKAYIFQNADRRIVFAIPYEREFTLIGTTDVDFDGNPDSVAISGDELEYLCASASKYFERPVRQEQVVWTYSGVRPLYNDGSASAQDATRDYFLDLQGGRDEPPLLNVFGGKITTYRLLAEETLSMLKHWLPGMSGNWTLGSALPGGDIGVENIEAFAAGLVAEFPALDPILLNRLARSYGTLAREILADVRTSADLGPCFGADLCEREVDYLVSREWAGSADDVLWRRTKLGLRLKDDEARDLAKWFEEKFSTAASPAR